MDQQAAKSRLKAGDGAAITAIGLIIVATTLFSGLDTAAKYLVTYGGMPVEQVVWVRFAAQFLGMLVLVPILGGMGIKQMFVTSAPWLQIARSILMALTSVFNFLAVKYLRLDQTITIMFLAPLLVALLAGPVLGEWIGWRRMVSILIGFAGVMIVVRPGLSEFNIGVLYSLGAMVALSGFILLTRKLAGRDPAMVTLMYSMIVGVVAFAPHAIVNGNWDGNALFWGLMISLGVLGGVGHYLFILAYKHVETSFLSPYLYVQIIGMITLGFLVFGDVPDVWTIAGSLVIVSSGLYVYHREHAKRTEQCE